MSRLFIDISQSSSSALISTAAVIRSKCFDDHVGLHVPVPMTSTQQLYIKIAKSRRMTTALLLSCIVCKCKKAREKKMRDAGLEPAALRSDRKKTGISRASHCASPPGFVLLGTGFCHLSYMSTGCCPNGCHFGGRCSGGGCCAGHFANFGTKPSTGSQEDQINRAKRNSIPERVQSLGIGL